MYKFKSRATGDLIMLEANGLQVLQILGKDGDHRGILLPEDMPAALQALEKAVDADEQRRVELIEQARQNGAPPPRLEPISLRLRVLPFIEMIRRCQQAEREIVWGV